MTSYEVESQFESRKEFSFYGEGAILLAADMFSLSDADFEELYGHSKNIIHEKMKSLDLVTRGNVNFETRNELWDFFITILS